MITLKTLPQATAQEVFDQIATHLLNQNEKSTTSGGACVYRNAAGLKCAAGCVIGDDEYEAEFEDASWGTLVDDGLVPGDHSRLIRDLQVIHDHTEPRDWVDALTKLAAKRKLSTTVIELVFK